MILLLVLVVIIVVGANDYADNNNFNNNFNNFNNFAVGSSSPGSSSFQENNKHFCGGIENNLDDFSGCAGENYNLHQNNYIQ
jgi:hypothetical protein